MLLDPHVGKHEQKDWNKKLGNVSGGLFALLLEEKLNILLAALKRKRE